MSINYRVVWEESSDPMKNGVLGRSHSKSLVATYVLSRLTQLTIHHTNMIWKGMGTINFYKFQPSNVVEM
jgi:hypothetical protein